MDKAELDELMSKVKAMEEKNAVRDTEELVKLLKDRKGGKVGRTGYGTGGHGIFKIEADDPTGAMSFVSDAEAILAKFNYDNDFIEAWDKLPDEIRKLLNEVEHNIAYALVAYLASENAHVVADDPDYNYLKDPEFDYLYTTKEEAIKNWPTWEDGTPVKIGEVAMSSRGPRTITGIELDGSGYTLWGRTDEVFDDVDDDNIVFNPYYIIDEGSFGEDGKQFGHPVRKGEECDFWTGDEQDLEETKEIDIRDIAERVKRMSRVYGYEINEVIEKVLEWI